MCGKGASDWWVHACMCLLLYFVSVHAWQLAVLCVCVALNKEDVHMSVFVPLFAYVCVSPVCELIWSSLNGYVHYRAMHTWDFGDGLILFRMRTEKRQDRERDRESPKNEL